jgi:hypothetical protein
MLKSKLLIAIKAIFPMYEKIFDYEIRYNLRIGCELDCLARTN